MSIASFSVFSWFQIWLYETFVAHGGDLKCEITSEIEVRYFKHFNTFHCKLWNDVVSDNLST